MGVPMVELALPRPRDSLTKSKSTTCLNGMKSTNYRQEPYMEDCLYPKIMTALALSGSSRTGPASSTSERHNLTVKSNDELTGSTKSLNAVSCSQFETRDTPFQTQGSENERKSATRDAFWSWIWK